MGMIKITDYQQDLRTELAQAEEKLQALEAALAKRDAERRHDALDGQATMEEAYNRIKELETLLVKKDEQISMAVDKTKRAWAEGDEALRDCVSLLGKMSDQMKEKDEQLTIALLRLNKGFPMPDCM